MVATAVTAVHGYELADIRKDVQEWKANARLISAAPDLVEALEDAIGDYDAWVKDAHVTPNESLQAWTNKARAAIAKAKGEA
jgi:NOL1/NOP2/fmu family ribosome biogenesis protein